MNLPQIPHYEFRELIGEGSCGYAYRCRYRDSDERLVKIVKGLAVNHGLFVSGMKTVAAAKAHRHLVDVCGYEFGENPGYYITSLHGKQGLAGGAWQANLIEPLMGNLPAEEAHQLIDQMADGLAHLHRLEVAHTAFKPSNIFIDENPDGSRRVRIADWGEGYVSGVHYLELGDRGFYASPEQLANGDFSQGRGKHWDVYAFGVVAYRLLTGLLPRLDPQFDTFIESRGQRDASALAYAQVIDEPGRYVDWIHAQPEVRWPGQPVNQAEADRRQVIERCLELDPSERLADMREVVAEFRQCENAALLRRIERDMTARGQKAADEIEARADVLQGQLDQRRKQVFRWRAIAAGIVAAVGLITWGGYKVVTREMAKADEQHEKLKAEHRGELAQQRLRFDIAMAEKDTTVATVERTAEATSEAVDATRKKLTSTREHGDRFFEMVLKNRDSDVPGYREERRRRLIEARDYYEFQMEAFANDKDLLEQSARGFYYLGQIYLEIGEPKQASRALIQAEQRYQTELEANDGIDAEAKAAASETLARIGQYQAELAFQQRPSAPETIDAILKAQQRWADLAAAQPDVIEWRLVQAENRLLIAQTWEARADTPKAMEQIEKAADELVALHEQDSQNDRTAASLGRAFAAIGGLLAEVGETEQAGALLDQSVALFSDAITLNGAVDDYQLWMAESLAEVGRMRRDTATLNDAVTVLGVAQARDPRNPRVASALAACLGALAEMQRDGGESAAAIEFERRAVAALESAMAGGGVTAGQPIRYLLAERKYHLAELHGDSEQFAESKKAVDSSIEVLTALLKDDPPNAGYQRLLARAQGLSAFSSEKVGDKDGARALYTAALSQWQAVSKDHPEDPQAAEGLSWTQRQLEALQ